MSDASQNEEVERIVLPHCAPLTNHTSSRRSSSPCISRCQPTNHDTTSLRRRRYADIASHKVWQWVVQMAEHHFDIGAGIKSPVALHVLPDWVPLMTILKTPAVRGKQLHEVEVVFDVVTHMWKDGEWHLIMTSFITKCRWLASHIATPFLPLSAPLDRGSAQQSHWEHGATWRPRGEITSKNACAKKGFTSLQVTNVTSKMQHQVSIIPMVSMVSKLEMNHWTLDRGLCPFNPQSPQPLSQVAVYWAPTSRNSKRWKCNWSFVPPGRIHNWIEDLVQLFTVRPPTVNYLRYSTEVGCNFLLLLRCFWRRQTHVHEDVGELQSIFHK